jgi:hypothetical protein
MLSTGLWRWYINITITILDIIHHPVFYLISLDRLSPDVIVFKFVPRNLLVSLRQGFLWRTLSLALIIQYLPQNYRNIYIFFNFTYRVICFCVPPKISSRNAGGKRTLILAFHWDSFSNADRFPGCSHPVDGVSDANEVCAASIFKVEVSLIDQLVDNKV